MTCPQCLGIEEYFDLKVASKDLQRYLDKGPDKTTQILIDALRSLDFKDKTLLDVGGGVGVISLELLKEGVSGVTHVEASSAYSEVAKREAKRRGYAERMQYYLGDFVDIAGKIPAAHIVTLDRVICCYHDMKRLINSSTPLSWEVYAVVYPRDVWWVKAFTRLQNLLFNLRGNPFRVFVHPTWEVDARIRERGFQLRSLQKTIIWQVAVYQRIHPR